MFPSPTKDAPMGHRPALGKPASYGDVVIGRRMQLIDAMGGFHGKRLLDVGCGNGAQTVCMLDRFELVVGLDVVQEHLSTLAEQLKAAGATNAITVLYDGHTMPFPEAHFDAVVSIETLEHVADESATLREIHRVLAPGGTAILSVPHKWWIFETHGANLPLLPWNRVPFFSWLPEAVHSRYARARIYTRGRIVSLLRAHGFEAVDTRYLMAPMDVVKIDWLAELLRGTIFKGATTTNPFLSPSVFVRARRL
jgi:ubiquinone/menaquinone biosynthesis C-methylase UbiE